MTHTQQTRLLNVIDKLRDQVQSMPIAATSTRTTGARGGRGAGTRTARGGARRRKAQPQSLST